MQEERLKLEQQITALLDKVQMLEYIVDLYQKKEEYHHNLNKQLEYRLAYLEAITEENKRTGAKVISISNIRKINT